MTGQLDDDYLTAERTRIEQCAAKKKPYFFNAKLDDSAKNNLEEYAAVCGTKAVSVDAEKAIPEEKEETPASIASVSKNASVLQQAIGDPFGLDRESSSMSAKDSWQKIEPGRKLQRPNVLNHSSSVIPIDGGEDYCKGSSLKVRRGQNSVADPDAIGKLAKEEDTGERLHNDNKQRAEQRRAEKKSWEGEAVETAKSLGAGSLPRGSVFITETGNANHGLRSGAGQYGVYETERTEVPDKTSGEQLKNKNDNRKTAIQRPGKNRKEWEVPKGASRPEITDVFVDELEKKLGKSGK
jgi:hypothetical protein